MSNALKNSDSLHFIQLRGSTTVMKLIQKIGFQYMDEYPNVRIPLVGGGSAMGYKSVLDGTSDIGMASGQIPHGIQTWAEKYNLGLEKITIANDGIAAIVNTANPISGLTLDQLHDVFTGKITSWNLLGKYSGSINVVSHDPQLGTYEPWKRQVAGKEHITLKAKVVSNLPELLEVMTSDPYAIGYLGTTFLGGAKVKPIAINGYMPTYQNILDEQYPIRNELQLLLRPNHEQSIKEFISYCLDPDKGQAIVKASGLVPVKAKL